MIHDIESCRKLYSQGMTISDIIDANGLRWSWVRSVDTETGEMERYCTNSAGELIHGKDGCPLVEHIKVAAPVLVKFKEVK